MLLSFSSTLAVAMAALRSRVNSVFWEADFEGEEGPLLMVGVSLLWHSLTLDDLDCAGRDDSPGHSVDYDMPPVEVLDGKVLWERRCSRTTKKSGND
jgi:hypothetical protein